MIYHIASAEAWAAAAAVAYAPASLRNEGFIHFSTRDQVIRTANTFYRGQAGLVLLAVDEALVSAEIRYENTTGGSELFPHLYGPLNVDAVVTVYPFEPGAGGRFAWPNNGAV